MSDDEAVGPSAEATPGGSAGAATDLTASGDPDEGSSSKKRTTPTKGSFWRELPVLLVIALVLALLLKAFLVQAFYIPSGSMENTLQVNDRVLVNKLVYDFRDIKRGEIIVFDANGSLAPDQDAVVIAEPGNPISKALSKVSTTLGFGVPPGEQDYIKRVIAVGGDRVMCCDAQSRVVVTPAGKAEGVALIEPYTFENNAPGRFCEAGVDEVKCPPGAEGVLVPKGRLWVMGDHRSQSSDSRERYKSYFGGEVDDGNHGTVSEDLVIGRALVTVWPLNHWDWLSVPDLLNGKVDAAPYAASGLAVIPLAFLRKRRRQHLPPERRW